VGDLRIFKSRASKIWAKRSGQLAASATTPRLRAENKVSSLLGRVASWRAIIMAASAASVAENIRQLNNARELVLADVNYYNSIVTNILPLLAPSTLPELRRWGADFLAEAFATPALPSREKETLSLMVLESLKGILDNADEDVQVLRSIVQACASIYPLAMRWM
jgi:hypothetical protein